MPDHQRFTHEAALPLLDTGGCARYGAGEETCRWKCGSQCAHPAPNPTTNDTFEQVLRRFVNRRTALRGAAAAAAAGAGLVVTHLTGAPTPVAAQPAGALTFQSIPLDDQDRITVTPGYTTKVLIRWGDPLFTGAPPFDVSRQTAEAQARQFGYNNDFIGYLPHPTATDGSRALLAVNHEYTNPELMFAGYDNMAPTRAQAEVEWAAHGLSVVEIAKTGGEWSYVAGSPYNRRITGTTPILITGPAAGHPWMRTSTDPSGEWVLGMLNNCGAGITPWGTVLTSEENFNQYFANTGDLPDDDPRKAVHMRYGMTRGASERKWERFDLRFDVAQEVNEPFRFGWHVEIDPNDPESVPRKRTALGRFKHEGAAFLVGPDGRVGVYMGDDERFDYMYKFVTAGRADLTNRAANRDLLDEGTLYVAKFNDDGTGEWLPLVFGQGPLTPANGWESQGDVLVRTRLAADAVGATKMDRPEDIDVSPVSKKIFMALTNNTNRTEMQVDKANPRARNRDGHIMEVGEAGDDPTALRFTWSIFMLCGEPSDASTDFAGFDKSQVSAISSPDNLAFDKAGNLWIFTDGQTGTLRKNDSVHAVPVAGPDRGHLRTFLNGVSGAEVASGDLSADNEALFVSIQHPGEGGSMDTPTSTFPDGNALPRPSVIVAWKTAAGEKRIGS